jgi:hypothetical protein
MVLEKSFGNLLRPVKVKDKWKVVKDVKQSFDLVVFD